MNQELGAGAIAAQIQGNNNTVVLGSGLASLTLERPHSVRWAAQKDSDLLALYVRATDLVGREADLSALRDWLDEPRSIACRCLTARAGAGKTRLAIELCRIAEDSGWNAGFVTHDRFREFSETPGFARWRWDRSTLIVVDYAAAFAALLRRWLDALASRPPDDPPLRLLLLERHADPQFGWWADLARPGGLSMRSAADLFDATGPVRLPGLADVEDRRALLRQVVHAAAVLRGVVAPSIPTKGIDADFDRSLADDAIEHEPLFLIMAGLVALTTGVPAALSLGRTDLALRIADAERKRLDRLAASTGLDAEEFRYMAACVILQGGCTTVEAVRLIEDERAVRGARSGTTDAVVRQLATAFPSPGSAAVDALRPDLIGEAFVLLHLAGGYRDESEQRAVVVRAFGRAQQSVLTTLVHAAQDYADGRSDHPSVAWLTHTANGVDDVAILMTIADTIPERTLALRELATTVNLRIANAHRTALQTEPASPRRLADRIRKLWSLVLTSIRPGHAVGNPDPPFSRSDVIRHHLASSLNNLSNRLSDLGRREAALAAIEEAVAIHRTLAAARPDAFGPDLALSLNNLSVQLSGLGRREAALAAIEEAVAIRRALAAARPDAFSENLAVSLWVFADCCDEGGDHEGGLAANREAILVLSGAFHIVPKAFAPRMSGMIQEYAQRCKAVDRPIDEELIGPLLATLSALNDGQEEAP